ncbi:thioredoxin family protein [Lederbergia graminis]|uniref:Thioredoxin family protein n=1 Tax=Lederbergia graminis TaxID=735518 RepID=A0ABW0LG28_9BACI
MKKLIIFLAIFIGLFATIAIVTKMQQNKAAEGNMYNKSDLHPETIKQLDDPEYQNIILPEELDKKLKDKEDVTVYFFSPICPYCVQTTPVINPVAEDFDIDLVQYNLLEFEKGFQQFNIKYTPTVIHFENGKEVARIEGGHPAENFKEFFTENVK